MIDSRGRDGSERHAALTRAEEAGAEDKSSQNQPARPQRLSLLPDWGLLSKTSRFDGGTVDRKKKKRKKIWKESLFELPK